MNGLKERDCAMKYFTKQRHEDMHVRLETSCEERDKLVKKVSERALALAGIRCKEGYDWLEAKKSFDDINGRFLEFEKQFWSDMQKSANDYWKYYEQIQPNLPEAIKSITHYDAMHDYVIKDTKFIHKDFCIIFENGMGVRFDRSQLGSIDLADSSWEYYFISELTFTNAKVLKNELFSPGKAWAYWLESEIYIQPNGYELRILALMPASDLVDDELAELIITFDDAIIKVLGGAN